MVNKVTAKLFPKYRTITQNSQPEADPPLDEKLKGQKYSSKIKNFTPEIYEIVNFAESDIRELENDIKSTGFYRNKAKNLQAAAKVLLEKYHGTPPQTIKELTTIPGVGRKTANVFLGNAYGIIEGIAVDTHVRKQAQLLGLTKEKTPEKIEKDLMRLFDKKDWFALTYLLIEHGRNMRKRKQERVVCLSKQCILCNQA